MRFWTSLKGHEIVPPYQQTPPSRPLPHDCLCGGAGPQPAGVAATAPRHAHSLCTQAVLGWTRGHTQEHRISSAGTPPSCSRLTFTHFLPNVPSASLQWEAGPHRPVWYHSPHRMGLPWSPQGAVGILPNAPLLEAATLLSGLPSFSRAVA